MERERALSTQAEAAQRYEADKKALIQGYEDKVHCRRRLCVCEGRVEGPASSEVIVCASNLPLRDWLGMLKWCALSGCVCVFMCM